MSKIAIDVPSTLAQRIGRLAIEENESLEDMALLLLRRGYDFEVTRPEVEADRSQRPGARSDARLDWWREAKFGLFIHWGLYSIPAGVWKGRDWPGIAEWLMYRAEIPVAEYEKLAGQFDPVKFSAREWVSLAKRAGQKYLVITSKHHDGFCLFDSAVTDFDMVEATPFKRDVLQELAEECAAQGIRLGFYYSQTQDWRHPDGDGNDWDFDPAEKDFAGYIEEYVKPHVRELLTNYGPIAIIWFDTPKGISEEQSRSLLALCNELQPDCLVCGRLGNALGDYATAGDNRIPETVLDLDWETPATMNDSWSYKVHDHNWKDSKDLIRKLVDIVSKGGNYLLNVGPSGEGVIPRESVERLEAVGGWLAANGEAIYGTQPGPIQGRGDVRTTSKAGVVYVHVFEWPADGQVRVEGVRAGEARLVASGKRLAVQASGDAVIVGGPSEAPDEAVTVIALEAQPVG